MSKDIILLLGEEYSTKIQSCLSLGHGRHGNSRTRTQKRLYTIQVAQMHALDPSKRLIIPGSMCGRHTHD